VFVGALALDAGRALHEHRFQQCHGLGKAPARDGDAAAVGAVRQHARVGGLAERDLDPLGGIERLPRLVQPALHDQALRPGMVGARDLEVGGAVERDDAREHVRVFAIRVGVAAELAQAHRAVARDRQHHRRALGLQLAQLHQRLVEARVPLPRVALGDRERAEVRQRHRVVGAPGCRRLPGAAAGRRRPGSPPRLARRWAGVPAPGLASGLLGMLVLGAAAVLFVLAMVLMNR
jgi:hypothetical protein